MHEQCQELGTAEGLSTQAEEKVDQATVPWTLKQGLGACPAVHVEPKGGMQTFRQTPSAG